MSSPRKSPLVPLVIALVAAVALIMVTIGGGSQEPAEQGERPPAASESTAPDGPDPSPLARRLDGDPLAIGSVDAPVVMVAFSEFQCPFCGKFSRDTVPRLISKYVDTGVLRIEWRDFPYLGEESSTAAHAARAAGLQGRFWEYHDAFFADQPKTNSGAVDQDFVEEIAARLDLDLDRFRADLGSDAVRAAVAADFEQGQSIGVTATPSLLINQTALVGAQPIEVFEQAIEEAASAVR